MIGSAKKGTITKKLNSYFIGGSNKALSKKQNELQNAVLPYLLLELNSFEYLHSIDSNFEKNA